MQLQIILYHLQSNVRSLLLKNVVKSSIQHGHIPFPLTTLAGQARLRPKPTQAPNIELGFPLSSCPTSALAATGTLALCGL